MAALKCKECGSADTVALGGSVSCYKCGALTSHAEAFAHINPDHTPPEADAVEEVRETTVDDRFSQPIPPPDTDAGTPTGGEDGYEGGPHSRTPGETHQEGEVGDDNDGYGVDPEFDRDAPITSTADVSTVDGEDDGLDDLSKAELYEKATDADIEGRSSMSKDELIEALRG